MPDTGLPVSVPSRWRILRVRDRHGLLAIPEYVATIEGGATVQIALANWWARNQRGHWKLAQLDAVPEES